LKPTDEYTWIEDLLQDDPQGWRDFANCMDAPPEYDRILFPWGRNPPETEETEEFLSTYCDDCPVAQRCLDLALKTESEGIWGGVELTPSRVARLRRLRTEEGYVTVERAKEVLGRGKA
jgi:hypothetical protein